MCKQVGGGGEVHSFPEIRESPASKIIWYFLDIGNSF